MFCFDRGYLTTCFKNSKSQKNKITTFVRTPLAREVQQRKSDGCIRMCHHIVNYKTIYNLG